MSLEYNLKTSKETIDHVRKVIPHGASNDYDNPYKDVAAVKIGDARVSSILTSEGKVSRIAADAISAGAGNCGEQAAVAYVYLRKKGVTPLEMMQLSGDGDHAWIVIGRVAGSNINVYSTWGGDAVICDPWYNITQKVSEWGAEWEIDDIGKVSNCRMEASGTPHEV